MKTCKIKIKTVVLIILISSFGLNLFAWEVKSDTTIYVGAWGGASYARIMGYNQSTDKPFVGFCSGITAVYHVSQEIGLRSGLYLINKGQVSQFEYFDIYDNPIGDYPTYYKFSYLTIPLELSFNLGRNKFNMFLSGGFHLGILLTQITYADLPETFNNIKVEPVSFNNSELYKKQNFGVSVGGGFEYKVKPNIIVFTELKYEHSFTQIVKQSSVSLLKHRNYYAGIGMRFGIPITYTVH